MFQNYTKTISSGKLSLVLVSTGILCSSQTGIMTMLYCLTTLGAVQPLQIQLKPKWALYPQKNAVRLVVGGPNIVCCVFLDKDGYLVGNKSSSRSLRGAATCYVGMQEQLQNLSLSVPRYIEHRVEGLGFVYGSL
jgi:hypothetical protein